MGSLLLSIPRHADRRAIEQQPATRRSTVNKLNDPILQVLYDYKAAIFARDVDAFVALYDQDVVAFDMWGAWSYAGIEAWRGMAAGWLGSLGTERVVVEFSNTQTIVAQDLAVAHAFVTYKAVAASGVELRSLNNRLTVALKRKGGVWRIVHEHTSSPVDFNTAKVILKR
jgi:ketosteroid isomerase-like protein